MIPGGRDLSQCSGPQRLPHARWLIQFLLAAFCLAAGVIPVMKAEQSPAGVVPWSTPERAATGFQFTEGPVWHPDAYLLFSDVQGNRIIKWTAPGQTETFRQPSGQSNGLAFDGQGRLIACEHGNRRVSRTETDGKVVALADRYDGKRLNSPNDLAIKSDGSIYFTDPPYGIDPGQQELPFNGVFRIPPKGDLTLLAADFGRPNGLAFSPDEQKLYIADTTGGHVRVFDVQPDGTLEGGAEFVQAPSPDGMKVDRKGKLYVATRQGVMVFNAPGETIGTIGFPEQPSNCCFGDAHGKTLFVTARTSLYRVRLNDCEIRADQEGNVALTWSSLPGKTYAVWQSDSAHFLTTTVAAVVVAGKGSVTTWTDVGAPDYYRMIFYKIHEVQ